MLDIICIGSATVDVFAKTEFSQLIHVHTAKSDKDFLAYPTGAKILVNELELTTGGGGTNTAVAFSQLGFKTGYLGKVGNDNNAQIVLQVLKKNKVTDLSIKNKGMTGYSIILDSIKHDRTILAYKGINDKLKFSEINKGKLKTRWFYFSSMLGDSFKTLEKLAAYAEKKNIKIAFNCSSYLATKGTSFLKKILKRCEVFILNKEEAELLVGNGNLKELLKRLRKTGTNIIVITDGKKGSYAYDGKGFYFCKTNKIKILETTGAGDAFAAGFVYGYNKHGLGLGMRLGTVNAESVIQHHGAKNKLLTYNEAMKAIKKYKVHVKSF